MKKLRLALDRGGPRRLEVRWGQGPSGGLVLLDSAEVATFDPSRLATGVSVALPDGTALRIERSPRRWWSVALRDDLLVDRQGVPVPGSDGDPRTIGRRAARLIALFGVLLVVYGLLWQLFSVESHGPGSALFLEGVLLLILAAVAAFGVRTPLLLAALLIAAEATVIVVRTGQFTPTALVVNALVVVYLVQSWLRMGRS
jgi:hypothetical protein